MRFFKSTTKHQRAGAAGPGAWLRLLAGVLLAALSLSAAALNCATPGKDGPGGTLTGIINSYWPGNASAAAGANSITLGAAIGSGNAIAIGDLLLVMQMQDAAIDSSQTSSYGDGAGGDPGYGATALNSSGLYEFVRATSAVGTGGGAVTIVGGSGGGLLNSYTNAAYVAGAQGQRRFQVIRVPQYSTATLGAVLTASAWNGRVGGVLVFDLAGQLTLGGATVSVDGLGFRGGAARQLAGGGGTNADYRTSSTINNNGAKGEGIAGTPRYMNNAGVLLDNTVEGYVNGSQARGAPGNAGGGGTDGNPSANDQNTGGGGGSNAGAGGKGGNSWDGGQGIITSGGWGGFDYSASVSASRLFMGGGGGSGTSNNGTGTPTAGLASSGASGGGLVMIRAGSISGSATITANGSSANNTVLNDGSGGGGAGGSVLVYSNAGSVGTVSVQANGGNGGTNTGGGSPHGPGGGGSGGFVATSGAASVSVSGGVAGTTAGGINYGALAGTSGASTGLLSSAQITGVKSGAECAIVVTKSFSLSPMVSGTSTTLTLTLSSSNNLVISGLLLSDVFPVAPGAMTVAAPLTTSNSCGGSLLDSAGTALAAGDVGVRLSGAGLAANSSCSFSIKVTAASQGSYVNSIAVGALASANGGTNASAASDTLVVTGPPSLVFAKTVSVTSDPFNGSVNPKNIPGAEVLYNLRVTNTGTGAVDLDATSISDPIPANTELFVGDLSGAGSGPVLFVQGSPSSALTWTYTALNNLSDDLDFSNDNGVTWTYVPTPPYDPSVNRIRLKPKGRLAGASGGSNPYFELRFRVRVK